MRNNADPFIIGPNRWGIFLKTALAGADSPQASGPDSRGFTGLAGPAKMHGIYRLRANDRLAWLVHVLEDKSSEETAALLGWSPNRTKNRIARAWKRLAPAVLPNDARALRTILAAPSPAPSLTSDPPRLSPKATVRIRSALRKQTERRLAIIPLAPWLRLGASSGALVTLSIVLAICLLPYVGAPRQAFEPLGGGESPTLQPDAAQNGRIGPSDRNRGNPISQPPLDIRHPEPRRMSEDGQEPCAGDGETDGGQTDQPGRAAQSVLPLPAMHQAGKPSVFDEQSAHNLPDTQTKPRPDHESLFSSSPSMGNPPNPSQPSSDSGMTTRQDRQPSHPTAGLGNGESSKAPPLVQATAGNWVPKVKIVAGAAGATSWTMAGTGAATGSTTALPPNASMPKVAVIAANGPSTAGPTPFAKIPQLSDILAFVDIFLPWQDEPEEQGQPTTCMSECESICESADKLGTPIDQCRPECASQCLRSIGTLGPESSSGCNDIENCGTIIAMIIESQDDPRRIAPSRTQPRARATTGMDDVARTAGQDFETRDSALAPAAHAHSLSTRLRFLTATLPDLTIEQPRWHVLQSQIHEDAGAAPQGSDKTTEVVWFRTHESDALRTQGILRGNSELGKNMSRAAAGDTFRVFVMAAKGQIEFRARMELNSPLGKLLVLYEVSEIPSREASGSYCGYILLQPAAICDDCS